MTRPCQAPGCTRNLTGRRRRFCSDDCARAGRRAERHTETPELAAAICRMLAVMDARFKDGDVSELGALWAVREAADQAAMAAVSRLRASGFTWSELAAELGVTLQAVQQWHGRRSRLNVPLKVTA